MREESRFLDERSIDEKALADAAQPLYPIVDGTDAFAGVSIARAGRLISFACRTVGVLNDSDTASLLMRCRLAFRSAACAVI